MKPAAPSTQKTKGARVGIAKKGISAGSADDKHFRDDMKKYEQDLTILSKRIADCQGDNSAVPGLVLPTQPESLFVNNLRNSVEQGSSGSENTLRLNMLERLMEKMGDLDRAILKKTTLATTAGRARRKSKDGSDLFCMPTHLLLVDRLLDVYTMSQRLQIIEKQKAEGAQLDGDGSKEMEEKKKNEINLLKKQLAEAEAARDKYKTIATAKNEELEAYKLDHNSKGKGKSATNAEGDVSTLTVTGEGRAIVSVEVDAGNHSKEIAALKASLKQSEQRARDMEERLEAMAASEQSTLNAIVSMTFALSNSQDVPTPEKLSLKFLNMEAKKATDQLLTTVVGLVSSKSKAAVEQYDVMLQEKKQATLELETFKTAAQSDLAKKNAEILALQESLSNAYEENAKAESTLEEVRDTNAKNRKELIQDYEGKILEFRAENASNGAMKRQYEKAKERLLELEKKCISTEDKNIELQGSLDCMKSDLAALETMNQKLLDNIKNMTNQATKNDFADTFEEVMREEMMAMKGAFEAKLKIAREQAEAMSRKRSSEISRIEGSRSTSGLR